MDNPLREGLLNMAAHTRRQTECPFRTPPMGKARVRSASEWNGMTLAGSRCRPSGIQQSRIATALENQAGFGAVYSPPTAANGGPKWTVDRTIFEMRLGGL